jgi:hypothetical protein
MSSVLKAELGSSIGFGGRYLVLVNKLQEPDLVSCKLGLDAAEHRAGALRQRAGQQRRV